MGLSPPTRGIRLVLVQVHMRLRSIPAYAGDPDWTLAWRNSSGVYPRLRGGSSILVRAPDATAGLSPPTRGIRCEIGHDCKSEGSIPAYAGDPAEVVDDAVRPRVYPRLRGGSSPGVYGR